MAQEAEDFAAGWIGDGPEYRFVLFSIQDGHISTMRNRKVTH